MTDGVTPAGMFKDDSVETMVPEAPAFERQDVESVLAPPSPERQSLAKLQPTNKKEKDAPGGALQVLKPASLLDKGPRGSVDVKEKPCQPRARPVQPDRSWITRQDSKNYCECELQ